MSKKIPSSSPDRHSFQRHGYLERCKKNGEDPNQDYLELFDKILDDHKTKWDEPQVRENNLEYDLLTSDWMLKKVRETKSYAQNLYAALCNNEFQRLEVFPILANKVWSCSWRYAGGIIADMREEGDYIDWYCSGIRESSEPTKEEWDSWSQEHQDLWKECFSKYVGEGAVTEEVKQDLLQLGWLVVNEDQDD